MYASLGATVRETEIGRDNLAKRPPISSPKYMAENGLGLLKNITSPKGHQDSLAF